MSAQTVLSDPGVEEQPAPGLRRRLPWLIGIGVLLVGLTAAAAWLLSGEGTGTEPPGDGEVVTLEPLTTTTGEAGLRHARVALSVVLTDGADTELVPPRAALLKDALLREVARMDADQLRSADGSDRLRVRLTDEAHEIWGTDVVRRVLITELLVQ